MTNRNVALIEVGGISSVRMKALQNGKVIKASSLTCSLQGSQPQISSSSTDEHPSALS